MTTLYSIVRQALGVATLGAVVATSAAVGPVEASGGGEIHRNHWSFAGMFGTFNQAQLQRGFLVYKDVCANCHGLSRVAFRNLVQPGGPAFPEAGVRSLADGYKIDDGPNDQGKMFQRPGRLSDTIPPPYKNEQEARSIQNGAYPPDLSLMARARNVEYSGSLWFHPLSMLKDIVTGYQEGGADYIYALMTSYHEKPPAYRRDGGGKLVAVDDKDVRDEKAVVRCVTVEKGVGGKPDTCTPMADLMHYNTAFPGHQVAMAQPLRDGLVKYTDGTAATVSNYAADVAAFLSWTADPSLEARKRLGWQVMLYLLITAVLLYLGKRALWRDVH
jgi:ubiquinol-cytochrome c reductase cytochrome c1 subunit